MRFVLIAVLCIFSCVYSKSNTKALTESRGQEVIEIGAPIKATRKQDLDEQSSKKKRYYLPPDLEEEPSAEDDIDKATSTTLQPATPRDARKVTTMESRRKLKDIDKIDNVKQEDEEARIEKELADLYKDTDYKVDSAEVAQEDKSTSIANGTEKPIGRMRDNFKFQPDKNNPREVERFRTSVDDISCSKNKLIGVSKQSSSGCIRDISRIMFWGVFILI